MQQFFEKPGVAFVTQFSSKLQHWKSPQCALLTSQSVNGCVESYSDTVQTDVDHFKGRQPLGLLNDVRNALCTAAILGEHALVLD